MPPPHIKIEIVTPTERTCVEVNGPTPSPPTSRFDWRGLLALLIATIRDVVWRRPEG
jgi:hypothetical protein